MVISGESYECKKARINNLTRKINGCLESEQFRNIKETITKELQRVTENTERSRFRLRELQEQYQREVENEFESETVRIENEEREFDNSEEEFSNRFGELEERYLTKAGQLQDSYDNYESPEQHEIDRIEKEIGELEKSYDNYESPEQEEIDRIKKEIGELEVYGLTLEERMDGITREKERIEYEISYTSNETRWEDASITGFEERTIQLSEQIFKESAKYNQDRERIGGEFDSDRERIEGKFNSDREELNRRFKARDFEQTSSNGKRIKEIIDGGAFLDIIEQNNREFVELRNAKEIIKSDAWREWDWS